MSFTDQIRRTATAEDCRMRWRGEKGGVAFMCYLCGHKFQQGDGFRFVFSGGANFELDGKKSGVTNFLTCDKCDTPKVIDDWVARNEEFYSPKYWALR